MPSSDGIDTELVRIRIVLLLMLAGILFLVGVLWRLQVKEASKYRSKFKRQSMRVVRRPGPRGRILDRNGVCLADNRPSYCIAVYVNELRQPGKSSNTVNKVEQVIDRISARLDLEREITRADIESHMTRRRPLPLLVWRDIGEDKLAQWQESDIAMPGSPDYMAGVAVGVEPVRVYPEGRLAGHILGFTGYTLPDSARGNEYHFHLPEPEGRYGIEKVWNGELSGKAGQQLMMVDASGFLAALVGGKDRGGSLPEPGKDIVLTIDVDIQKTAESILKGEKGAAVVLDPRNGDVLAMASSPGFEPSVFTPKISLKDWKRLESGSGKPLLNRCISEVYAVGSTFKPVVAMAALSSGKAGSGTVFNCPGYFSYGRLVVRCWKKSGHGRIKLRKALEQSCNTYFCHLGTTCGYRAILSTARELGMGSKTGINLEGLAGEVSGLVPSDSWKRRVHGDRWRIADTCHLSIGQGPLNATPLQMAVVISAIANGGYVWKPRLTLDGSGHGEVIRKADWRAEDLETVRGGLFDVVEAPRGTGKRARIVGVRVAGKTGTAEYGGRKDPRKHAWMLAFAPFENPRYAVAVVVEDALSGGRTAAPKVRLLLKEIFKAEGRLTETPADEEQAG